MDHRKMSAKCHREQEESQAFEIPTNFILLKLSNLLLQSKKCSILRASTFHQTQRHHFEIQVHQNGLHPCRVCEMQVDCNKCHRRQVVNRALQIQTKWVSRRHHEHLFV